jgi:coproporphyrinogen III oxidase
MTPQTPDMMDDQKTRASAWFRSLRDQIVAAFEGLEDTQATGPFADRAPGRFEVSETKRTSDDGSDAGGVDGPIPPFLAPHAGIAFAAASCQLSPIGPQWAGGRTSFFSG